LQQAVRVSYVVTCSSCMTGRVSFCCCILHVTTF